MYKKSVLAKACDTQISCQNGKPSYFHMVFSMLIIQRSSKENLDEQVLLQDDLPTMMKLQISEVFTVPHVLWSNSSQTRLNNNVSRIQFFLVNFCIIFQSLSGCNSGHFPTRQFVYRTFRLDSPVDMTRQ
jgi:hypothetical protein